MRHLSVLALLLASSTVLAQEPIMRRGPSKPDEIRIGGPLAVPMTQIEHLPAVEIRINGKGPYRFAIDSGSGGMLMVSETVAQSLGLETIGQARIGDPSGKNSSTRPVVRIDSVQIGDAQFSGLHGTVGNGLGSVRPDGIIGLALFGDLTVTLDYPKQELRLARRPLDAKGEHVVAFTRDHNIPTIEVDAAGTTLKAHIDTGSPSFLSVPASAKLTFASEPRVVGRGRTTSNEFEIRAAELSGDVRIGGRVTKNATVDIVDLFPIANIGSRFLRQHAVTFDLANSRVAFE